MARNSELFRVVDPRSRPPATIQRSMAPRLDSLKGKTVYVVDINWPYTHQFTEELHGIFSEKFPDTRFVLSDKSGSYFADDPKLWAEIKENADAMILGVGQ